MNVLAVVIVRFAKDAVFPNVNAAAMGRKKKEKK